MSIGASTQTLDDMAGTSHTYRRLFATSNESRWIRTDSDLTEPRSMVLRHETVGKGSNVTDRHNIRFGMVKIGTDGVTREATVNVTIAVPRSGAFTEAMIEDLILEAVNLVTDQSQTAGFSNFTTVEDLLIGVL